MSVVVLLPEVLVVLAALGALLGTMPERAGLALLADEEQLEEVVPPLVAACLVVALGLELWLGASVGTLFGGGFSQDRFALLAKAAVLVALILAVASTDWAEEHSWLVMPMILLTGLGGMVAASATSLVGLWAGFQLSAAAAAVALSGRHREDALRAVLAAGLSGSLLALGFAYIYGSAGVSSLAGIRTALGTAVTLPLALAVLVSLLGLGIGLLLAPFHLQAERGYRRATPLGAAALGGVAVVSAAVVGLKLGAALVGVSAAWVPFLTVVAALTMLAGATTAAVASSPRTLVLGLALSQSGWLAAGLATHDRGGLAATAFLLGAFAVAAVAAPVLAGPAEAGFAALRNLGDRQPARAAGLALALLSLAGAPPLAGFFGEFTIAVGLIQERLGWLLGLGLITGVIATIACLRALRLMFFETAAEEGRRRGAYEFRSVGDVLRFAGGLLVAVVCAGYGLLANPIHGLAVQGAAALGLR